MQKSGEFPTQQLTSVYKNVSKLVEADRVRVSRVFLRLKNLILFIPSRYSALVKFLYLEKTHRDGRGLDAA